ncbi:PREDICTED: uncharacterized protein LOC104730157 isoform X2 [Camelina sativa]|uniref:Uncharacterized protein LOC104730157 isoform X2 n=1 Tax=Camelina sativa TaxID=90675 RepID=A0ABM0UWZ1_CAMSA|nr:PREDICTED: uncharacterized protein LOC104730157 isoform X2 [Camelina sativa]
MEAKRFICALPEENIEQKSRYQGIYQLSRISLIVLFITLGHILLLSMTELNPSKTRMSIAVKVLRLWTPHIILGGPNYKCLILVDEKGKRIDAQIRARDYFDLFVHILEQGKWFLIYKFIVRETQQESKNSNNQFKILITCETKVTSIPPRSSNNFFLLTDGTKFENATPDERNCCVDFCGKILTVGERTYMTFLDYKGGYNGEKNVVPFTVLDIDEKVINCMAVGETCLEFIYKMDRIVANPTYQGEQIMCMLMFWRTSTFGGVHYLMSQMRCSYVFVGDEVQEFTRDPSLAYYYESSDDEDYEGTEEEEIDSS